MENTKGERTKRRIINAAKVLFGTKTYDYVTTRMIAKEAGCSQSAISFYFETKENLCAAVIDDILKSHQIYYRPIAQSVEECVARGEMNPEKAMGYLQQYLNVQFNLSFDPRNRCAFSFSVNGSTLPEGLSERLDGSIMANVTYPIAQLLIYYANIPIERAIVYSQALANSIITYMFTGPNVHQELMRYREVSPNDTVGEQMVIQQEQQYLMEFCLNLIRGLK